MPKSARVILYVRGVKRALYMGVISDHDGVLRSAWKVNEGGNDTKFDRHMDRATFDTLWKGVTELEAFKRFPISNGAKFNFKTFHSIQITVANEGDIQERYYAVPDAAADPEFMLWVSQVNPPIAEAPIRSMFPMVKQFFKKAS